MLKKIRLWLAYKLLGSHATVSGCTFQDGNLTPPADIRGCTFKGAGVHLRL